MDMLKKAGICARHEAVSTTLRREQKIWKVREGGLGSTAWVPDRPDAWPGWEDSAVPPEKRRGLPARACASLFDQVWLPAVALRSFRPGLHPLPRRLRPLHGATASTNFVQFMDEAADLVVSFGGSLSGEHGDGQARGEYVAARCSAKRCPGLSRIQGDLGSAWQDESGQDNRCLSGRRESAARSRLQPAAAANALPFPDDKQIVSRALRCAASASAIAAAQGGQGHVPQLSGHARGKAFDARPGATAIGDDERRSADRWLEERGGQGSPRLLPGVQGLQGGCPVNVDMATYKAEFLSHYYEGRLRPRHAYAMGWIYWWARLASLMPGMCEFFFSRRPGCEAWRNGSAASTTPAGCRRFAAETFRTWFRERRKSATGRTAGHPMARHIQ